MPNSQHEVGVPVQHRSSEINLNYNAPLLSVRRLNAYSSVNEFGRSFPSPRKPYKLSSELSAESLRIPGAVPFRWEQTPGRPKNLENNIAEPSLPSSIQSPRDSPANPEAAERTLNISSGRTTSDQQIRSDQSVNLGEPKHLEGSPCHHGRTSLSCLFQRSRKCDSMEESECSSPSQHTVASSLPNATRKSLLKSLPGGKTALTLQYYLNSPQDHFDMEGSSSDVAESMASPEFIMSAFRVSMDENDEGCSINQARMDSEEFIIRRFLPAARTVAADAPQRRRWSMQENLTQAIDRKMSKGSTGATSRSFSPSTQEKESLDEEDELQNASLKACGFFSIGCGSAFLHLSRGLHSVPWSRVKRKDVSSLPCLGKLSDRPYKVALDSSCNEVIPNSV
eukprot:c19707_g1_i2 orf=795-1979(+)